MKQTMFIFISLFLLLSCSKNNTAFDSFDYSYDDTFSKSYSIKLTDSDTVFLRYHFVGINIYDTLSVLKENKNYYGILNPKEKITLFEYIGKVKFFKYNSEYYERYVDGSFYAINIEKDGKRKTIFVHSHKAPAELDSLAKRINYLTNKLQLKEVKKALNFESAKSVLPPPPPPPPIKNSNN